jgi:hypothetical protein
MQTGREGGSEPVDQDGRPSAAPGDGRGEGLRVLAESALTRDLYDSLDPLSAFRLERSRHIGAALVPPPQVVE